MSTPGRVTSETGAAAEQSDQSNWLDSLRSTASHLIRRTGQVVQDVVGLFGDKDELLEEQLEKIARVFNLEVTENFSSQKEACFDAAYLACKRGEWETVRPIYVELSLLRNQLGHTLLIRALMREESEIVRGLAERQIALLTPDAKGNTPFCYIQTGVGGEDREAYQALIWSKAQEQLKGLSEAAMRERVVGPKGQFALIKLNQGYLRAAHMTKQMGGLALARDLYGKAHDQLEEDWGQAHPACAACLTFSGQLSEKLQDYDSALKSHLQVLEYLLRIYGETHQKVLDCLEEIGKAYGNLKDHKKAKEFHQRALDLALLLHGEKHLEVFICFVHLGVTAMHLDENAVAITQFEKALQISHALPEAMKPGRATLISLQLKLAKLYKQTGRQGEGMVLAASVLIGQEQLSVGPLELVNTIMTLGECAYYGNLGYRAAKPCFDRALHLIRAEVGENCLAYADACSAIADHYLGGGRMSEAKKYGQQALAIYEKELSVSDPKIGRLLVILAQVYEFSSQSEQAESTHERALKILENKPEEYASALNTLATFYSRHGSSQRAQEFAKRTLEVTHNHPAAKLGSLVNMAYLKGCEGTKESRIEAKTLYLEVLRIAEEKADMMKIMTAVTCLGRLCEDLGEYEEALGYYVRAFKESDVSKNPSSFGNLLVNMGYLAYKIGALDSSLEYLSGAIEVFIHTDSQSVIKPMLMKFNSLKALGKNQEAENCLKMAIDTCEVLRRSVSSDEWKITIFEEQSWAYRMLEMLFIMQSTLPNREDALLICDYGRAKALISFLDKQLKQDGEDLVELFSCSDSQMVEQTKVIPLQFTTDDMRRVAKEQDATLIVLSSARAYSRYSKNRGLVSKSMIDVWVIDPVDGINYIEIPEEGLIESCGVTVSEVDFPFKGEGASSSPIPNIDSIEEFDEMEETKGKVLSEALIRKRQELRDRFDSQLQNWHRILIDPITAHLPKEGGKKLLFIPDHTLATLPFSLFRGENGRFLFQDFAIGSAPSVRALDLLHKRKQMREPLFEVLIVDDPISDAGALKTGGMESKKLSTLMQVPSENILAKEQATVNEVKTRMKRAGVLHLSCHGSAKVKSYPHSIYHGGLYFASDEQHPSGELSAEEIVKTTTSLDLVFMSACSTGLGRQSDEGVIGLVRSLLVSGSSTVISSLWKVGDTELNVKMIERFYQCLIREKLGKAESLRQAMLLGMSLDPEAIEQWGVFSATGIDA